MTEQTPVPGDDLGNGASAPVPEGVSAALPNPALILGMQVFNWLNSPSLPKGQARLLIQAPMVIDGSVQLVEIKTAKMDRDGLKATVAAIKTARPDLLASRKVTQHPKGRKGPYEITHYGVIDRNLSGGTGDTDAF